MPLELSREMTQGWQAKTSIAAMINGRIRRAKSGSFRKSIILVYCGVTCVACYPDNRNQQEACWGSPDDREERKNYADTRAFHPDMVSGASTSQVAGTELTERLSSHAFSD